MTVAQKNLALAEPVVRWNAQEALAVALRYFPLKHLHPEMDLAVVLNESQQCLPKERQRSFEVRYTCYNTIARLNKLWEEYAAKNPKQAELFMQRREILDREIQEEIQESAEAAVAPESPKPETPSAIAEQVKQARKALEATSQVTEGTTEPPAPAAPAPHLGPLEMAMAAMVQRAVEGSLGRIIIEMEQKLLAQQEFIQSLLNAQHDSLMGYFDPDFKRTREIQAEFITASINDPASQLKQVRMRRKKVLIVCTNNLRGIQNTIESKFSGIDFTFVDGNLQRQVNAGGFYDLVLCNATNRAAVKDRLALLHGVKVVFTDGGNNSMIDIIRHKLGI